MIKLTQVIFQFSEAYEKKIKDISEIYQEEVRQAELSNGIIPQPPTIKPKPEDYISTLVPLFIDKSLVKVITSDILGATVISDGLDIQYNVAETPRQVCNLLKRK
jgi:hypothetical protein